MQMQFLNDPEWMQEVLQASNTGLWMILMDEKGEKKGMYASDMMLKLLGLLEHPEPESCYQHWEERIEEKYKGYVHAYVEQMISTGKFLEVQYQWKHDWWGNIFVRCGGRAEKLPDGRIQIKGYHQNINELELLKQENRLRNAEIEEIRQRKKKYDELFDSVLCGIINYKKENQRLRFKRINQEALRIFQYEPAQFWERKSWELEELIAGEDIPAFLAAMEDLKEIGDMVSRELRLLTKEGKRVWVIETTELIRDMDGEEVFQSVFIDNDDYKKKTVLLEELTENIPGGVCLLDLERLSTIYGNEGYYKLLGCSEQEMREVYQYSLEPFLRKLDRNRLRKIIEEADSTGKRNVEFELLLQQPGGSKMWVLVKGTRINSCGSHQLNCVLIDITDRKNIEQEMFLNERRLSIALEQTANIVFDFDIQSGRAVLKNGNFGAMVSGGIVEHAAKNLVKLGILHRDYQKSFEEMWKQIANGEETASRELLVRYRQGAPYVWTKAVLRTIYTENGVPLRAVGILEDISLQKSAELAFIKEERYRQAMLAETLAFAEINVTRNLVEKTGGCWKKDKRAVEAYYDEILDSILKEEIYFEDREAFFKMLSRESLLQVYAQGQTELWCEHRQLDKEGKVRWMQLTAHLLKEPLSGELKALIYLKDIDRKKKLELAMKYQSERDSLTGLYNKGTAEKLMKRFLEEELRQDVLHAFIILDMDQFKVMNDSYGHQYGDEVLREVAGILKEAFRLEDIEGRLGGDEMVVLMKEIPSKKYAEERLKLVQKRLAEASERRRVKVTASIGVSFFPEHGRDYQRLYRTADIALYQAKKRGKNQFASYEKNMEL